jgi:hypothetical protein
MVSWASAISELISEYSGLPHFGKFSQFRCLHTREQEMHQIIRPYHQEQQFGKEKKKEAINHRTKQVKNSFQPLPLFSLHKQKTFSLKIKVSATFLAPFCSVWRYIDKVVLPQNMYFHLLIG